MAGPAPKPNAERRRRNAPRANTRLLPAAGRPGEAPQWPLPLAKPPEWDEIWKLPQAVMWEKMRAEVIVARYLDLRSKIHDPDFPEGKNASFWNVLNSLEDRLGLTPMAMMKLQWEIGHIEEEEAPAAKGVGTVTRIDQVKKRLQEKSP